VISSNWDTNNVWIPLSSGRVQRIAFNKNLHLWRNQPLPGTRQWGLDTSLYKNVNFGERLSLRVGGDFFNVFNHPGNPTGVREAFWQRATRGLTRALCN